MIPDIQIDPRNEYELLEQATNHAIEVSGGTLSNFNPSDPMTALIEGQVYAGAELLWYLNRLPASLATYWLNQFGYSTDQGAIATGIVDRMG
jgi:hypothetical protein